VTADTTVCVFAKEPRPGLAKTRLISALGARGAAALASAFLADTLALVAALPLARLVVVYDGEDAARRFDPTVTVWPQGGGDMGERMERALARALADTPLVILIGSDLPGLPPSVIEDARRFLLDGADVTLGPAADGGFYLIGLRRCPAGLLSGLPWSVAETRQRSEERFAALGLRVARVASWFDVDCPQDIDRLRERVARGVVVAPATRRALAELGVLKGD
jgi:rSAM/selenodomain-associated transferase 1